MIKILVITYYWPPGGGAGVQRWLKFTKYLPEYGVEPLILTVDPDYASYPQIDRSLENGISPGLRVFKTKSFEVLRLIAKIFGKRNIPYGGFSNVDKSTSFQTFLRFIRGNFFIPDARNGWKVYALKEAKRIIDKYSVDLVVTTGPPHSTHLIGMELKKETGLKWIADFRDPWTDIYYYSDLLHTWPVRWIDRCYERRVLSLADSVIGVNNSVSELLASKVEDRKRLKFRTITNGYDPEDFDFSGPADREFVITYTGTMSEHYDCEIFFIALAELKSEFPSLSVKFRVAGHISSSVESWIKRYGLEGNFDYRGYVSRKDLADILNSSTMFLYVFPKTSGYRGSSGKLFEYLAMRRPVIAIDSPDSDAAAIIEECDSGRVFSPDNKKGLGVYLRQQVNEFIEKGSLKAGNDLSFNYSREKLTADLAGVIKSTLRL